MPDNHPIARIERSHNIYKIVSQRTGEAAHAAAYAGSRRLFTVTAANVDQAAEETVRRLEARSRQLRCGRQAGIPTAEELRDLLDALPSPWRSKLLPQLQAHAALPEAEGTAVEIARRAGCEAHQVWWCYGRLGRKLVSALSAQLPRRLPGDTPEVRGLLTFAELRRGPGYGDWIIRLRPEALEAVTQEDSQITQSERRRA